MINVPIQHSGLLSAVQVLGQGNPGIDFVSANSGSCIVGVSYPAGQSCTVGIIFKPQYPGVRTGAVVLTDGYGAILGTQSVSGTGYGAIATFVPGMISTVAGQATWLYDGDGRLATNSSLFLPFGVAVDSVGNVYIADQGNNRVRKVSASTGLISTVAGNGNLGAVGDGGQANQASLSEPSSVALDGAGNIYICDTGNNAVRKVAITTGTITTVAGTLSKPGYSGDGFQATSAALNSPNGIALDSSGNLFIADTGNNVIRKVDASNGIISTVAGTGSAGSDGDGGPATLAHLNAPWSITPAPGSMLYIADQGNNRIRKVDAAGQITTTAGTGLGSFSGDTGPALQANLDSPASVAIDVAGNLYVADSGNNRIRKIAYNTGFITTIAGSSSEAISGDGGPATASGLYGPYTLALDGVGNLYFADVFHNRIRKVAADTSVVSLQPMRIGRVAEAQQQSLENDGNAPLNITLLQAVSDSVIDAQTTTCSTPMMLTPLSSCIIGAAFAPTHLGTPDIGIISVTSDATDANPTIELMGNVLSEDPSTVTIAASANPITVGDTVYFTVAAASNGAVPTGQVTLLDGSNSIGSTQLQAGGVATFQVSTLTGGQHTLTASYGGDSNNTSGVSAPLVETVKFITAPTQTRLTSSTNPIIAGTSVKLLATVTVINSGSGNGAISGPVTFTDGGTIIGVGSVSGGTASMSLSTLSVGQHMIVASYGGTSDFAASSSAPITLTIQPATTTTSLASASNPSFGGATIILTASVVGDGVTPTGTFTFFNGTKALGSASVNQGGQATLPVTGLKIGSYNIVAMYSGDTFNNPSSSGTLLQTVSIASTTGTVSSSLNPAPQGSSLVITATIAGNGGVPTGTVEFLDGSATIGPGSLSTTGTASIQISTLGLGSHSIYALYQGDGLDRASTSTALLQVVVAATTNVALSSNANPDAFGAPLVLSVVVQGTGTQPTGSVTLQDGTTALGTATLNSAGLATFTNLNLAIGTHDLTAYYSGDPDHTPKNATLAQSIVQTTSTAFTSSSPSAAAGTKVTWTAVVSGLSGQPVTGKIQFMDGPAVVATVPIDVTGTAAFSSAAFSIGTHTMSASYLGDALNQASNSSPLLQAVQIAMTATSLSPSANPAFAGSKFTLSATVSGNGGAPTGSITFRDTSTVLATVPIVSGSATFSTSTLAPGTHTLTASYTGDSNDAPSTSSPVSEQILQQTTLTIASSANPSMFQDGLTITATVSGGLPAFPATGTVSLTEGSVVIATASVDVTQRATFTLTAPLLGVHTFQATYAGDAQNSPVVSQILIQSVILRPTITSLTTSATSLSAGQPVTFVSVVQGTGQTIPTGVVTFVSGSTVLGTAPLSATGVAVLTFQPQQATDSVVAQYPGDALFAASNSGGLTVIVGPTVEFSMTATPAVVSLSSGGHTTLQIKLQSAPSFSDTIDLGCAGLPAFATCTFSQDQIEVSGGTTQTFSLVLDTGTPLGAGPSAQISPARSSTALACMLPGGGLLAVLLLRPRRFRKRLGALAMLLVLTLAGGLSGCATSLHMNSTPPGTYSFQIIGTGAVSGATQSGTVSMTVAQ